MEIGRGFLIVASKKHRQGSRFLGRHLVTSTTGGPKR